MSINDILNNDSIIPLIFLVLALSLIISIIIKIFNSVKKLITDSFVKTTYSNKPNVNISGEFIQVNNNESYAEIHIHNLTDKNISAIGFFVKEYDVYGEELTTDIDDYVIDNPILSYYNKTIRFEPSNSLTSKLKIYFYNIYFDDSSKWGDKDASKSVILKKSYILSLSKIRKSI